MSYSITGRARTDRAGRYLKQLCSHLSEKIPVEFDASGGTVRYEDVTAVLTPTDGTLEFAISGEQELHFYRAMGIVSGHLEKFGARDRLVCEWDDPALAAAFEQKRAAMMATREEEMKRERERAENQA